MLRSRFIAAVLRRAWPWRCADAVAQAFKPFVVKDIRVEGLQRTEPGTVFSYLPVKVGETMDEQRAQRALRALFATGFFQDVRLEVEGDVLVVLVTERPAISQIDFVGMKEFEPDVVKKVLRENGMAEGRIFDRSVLDLAEQELKKQYLSKGMYAVRGADHRDAARAQPRRRQHLGHRGRGGQDPRHQHRRRRGVPRERAAVAVHAAHAGLAHLVHQARPLRAREPGRRPRAAALLLPEPRLPRLQHRVDAGRRSPPTARTSTSPSTSSRARSTRCRRCSSAASCCCRARSWRSWCRSRPARCSRARS